MQPRGSEIKFPHSVNLFLFCKRILDLRFQGSRVIDQDVGQILEFDPADCSHWKNGKKQIRSIFALRKISQKLEIDESIVLDVASGELDPDEAVMEVTGYGSFDIDSSIIDRAKKNFYRSNPATGSTTQEPYLFSHNLTWRSEIIKFVDDIMDAVGIKEPPIFLPEVLPSFGRIRLIPDPTLDRLKTVIDRPAGSESGDTTIRFGNTDDLRPSTRFLLAQLLARIFLKDKNILIDLSFDREAEAMVNHVFTNAFALELLMPEKLIRKQVSKIPQKADLVGRLAEEFWVSKHLVNTRLKELLRYGPSRDI